MAKGGLPRYRRPLVAKELVAYIQAIIDPETEATMGRTEKIIVREMRKVVTERELECLQLYYLERHTYEQMTRLLGINVATVCRNVHRGEGKLGQIITFAKELLGEDEK